METVTVVLLLVAVVAVFLYVRKSTRDDTPPSGTPGTWPKDPDDTDPRKR